MKLNFNNAVKNALASQAKIRSFIEAAQNGDFGDEVKNIVEIKGIWDGEATFLLEELFEKLNLVASELKKGNDTVIKEFFDYLCIDISKESGVSNG